MRKRRCAAMLVHRGCNDDTAHNDHIPRPDHDGARRTAAAAKGWPMPKWLSRKRWLLRTDVGQGASCHREAGAMSVGLDAERVVVLHRDATQVRSCSVGDNVDTRRAGRRIKLVRGV